MNRLSRAIKRGLVSTEGLAQGAFILITSWWLVLEAFGCWGCCYFSGTRQQLRNEGRPISSAHSAASKSKRRLAVFEKYRCVIRKFADVAYYERKGH